MDRAPKRTRTRFDERLVECLGRCGRLTNNELDRCARCLQAMVKAPSSLSWRSQESRSPPVPEHTASDGGAANDSISINPDDEYNGMKYGVDDDESGDYSDGGIASESERARERSRKRPAPVVSVSPPSLHAAWASLQSNISINIPVARTQRRSAPAPAARSSRGPKITEYMERRRSSTTLRQSQLMAPQPRPQQAAPRTTLPAVPAADGFDVGQMDDRIRVLQSMLDDSLEEKRLGPSYNALLNETQDLRSQVQSLEDRLRNERAVFLEQLASRDTEVSDLKEELQTCKDEVSRGQVTIGILEAHVERHRRVMAELATDPVF